MEDSDLKPLICAACDLVIEPALGETLSSSLTPNAGHSELEEVEHEGCDNGSHIPTPEAWSTFCKYLLDGSSSRAKTFRTKYYEDLTFCALCMRLITKINAFENEISQLYERIDSMVTCLKTKIQISVDTSSITEKLSVREFMLGLQPTDKSKGDGTPKKGKKGKQLIAKASTMDDTNEERSEADPDNDMTSDYHIESDDLRSEDDWGSGPDLSLERQEASDTAEVECDDGPSKEPMKERKPRATRKSAGEESQPQGRRKRNRKDTRERKTGRRRLDIKQLEEPDLFEWKGFRFRKLETGKLKCEHCPSSLLNSQPNLILHIRKVHLREGVGVFPCPVCGKSFDRAEILKAHMFIHDEKRFQCYLCGKCYHQRGNLTHHIKTHTGNLKYECEIENCGKKFLTRNQLTRHTSRHLGVKSFQCEYCSRLFVEQSELNRHVRSHAEENPFKCHMCNSSFFIKYRLRRHYMNVHKVQPPDVIEMVELKLPPKPHLEGTTSESTSETGFIEETVVTESEPPNVMNIHKELITFQSMLE